MLVYNDIPRYHICLGFTIHFRETKPCKKDRSFSCFLYSLDISGISHRHRNSCKNGSINNSITIFNSKLAISILSITMFNSKLAVQITSNHHFPWQTLGFPQVLHDISRPPRRAPRRASTPSGIRRPETPRRRRSGAAPAPRRPPPGETRRTPGSPRWCRRRKHHGGWRNWKAMVNLWIIYGLSIDNLWIIYG